MSLYEALRAAGLDLQRAHRLDAYVRATGEDAADGFVRSLLGDRADAECLRTSLAADVEALTAGVALLDAARRSAALISSDTHVSASEVGQAGGGGGGGGLHMG